MTEQIDRRALTTPARVGRRRARLVSVVLVAATATVGVAACGGSKKPSGSANCGAPPAVTVADRYSACMRSRGVANFPDPQISSNGGHKTIVIKVDPTITNSPAFKSARRACAYLVPTQTTGPIAAQQQAQTSALLAFARCMREHGFASFPDPNTQGEPWTLAMLTGAGINLKEPAVRPAALACTSVTTGILTKADVENAIANPNQLRSQPQAAP